MIKMDKMILISEQALKDILYETDISPKEKGKLVAKIENCNLYKENKKGGLRCHIDQQWR